MSVNLQIRFETDSPLGERCYEKYREQARGKGGHFLSSLLEAGAVLHDAGVLDIVRGSAELSYRNGSCLSVEQLLHVLAAATGQSENIGPIAAPLKNNEESTGKQENQGTEKVALSEQQVLEEPKATVSTVQEVALPSSKPERAMSPAPSGFNIPAPQS